MERGGSLPPVVHVRSFSFFSRGPGPTHKMSVNSAAPACTHTRAHIKAVFAYSVATGIGDERCVSSFGCKLRNMAVHISNLDKMCNNSKSEP